MSPSSKEQTWKRKLMSAVKASDTGASGTDLAEAPSLNYWRAFVTPRGAPFLWGMVSGHPRLGSRWITTSHLVAIDPMNGWARTASRWYRIERPFSDLEAKGEGTSVLLVEMPGCQSLDDITKLSLLLSAWRDRILQAETEGDGHVK